MAEFKPAKLPEKPSETDQAVSQASSSTAVSNKPAEETVSETKKDEVNEPKEEQMDVTQQEKNEEDGNESNRSDQESSSKVPEPSDAVGTRDSKDTVEAVAEKAEAVQSSESDKKPKEVEKEDDREVQIIFSTQTAPTSDAISTNANPEKHER